MSLDVTSINDQND